MFKKLILLPTIFILNFFLANQINQKLIATDTTNPSSIELPLNRLSEQSIVFAALPSEISHVQTSVKTADARPEIIRQYLEKYNSPLEPYADLLVQVADENDFDYRWMVAIAQQESNLCKKIPYESYNCWGWGIYGDKVTRFDSYEQAIKNIAPQFKETFLKDEHLGDPHSVMQTYTPPSQGSWAQGVLQFFGELE